MLLFIIDQFGKRTEINAEPSETIIQLRESISKEIYISADRLKLVYNDRELEGEKTLSYYNIESEARIHLTILKEIQIFIKMISGKILTVRVDKNDTIRDLKNIINERDGYPIDHTLRITYGGRTLEDERTIDHYDIQKEATLLVLKRLWGG